MLFNRSFNNALIKLIRKNNFIDYGSLEILL